MSKNVKSTRKDEIAIQSTDTQADAKADVPVTAAEREWPWVRPEIDILEGDQEMLLVADMPGVSRDTLSLTLERDILTVEGRWANHGTGEQVFSERTPVNYRRALKLPRGLNLDGISARLEAGVLEVHLPRAAELQPRQIQVQGVN